MALIRMGFLAALIYGGFLVAFPDYTGNVYHMVVPCVIAGGVVGVYFLHKILDLGEGMLKFAIEGAFLLGVAGFLGYTMPQKSGKAPLEQWAEGARPTQDSARRGLERLGADPRGAVGSKIVGLFPKR